MRSRRSRVSLTSVWTGARDRRYTDSVERNLVTRRDAG
ncbi:hypothetical protein ARZXY2_4144 [Arthrobacter sp. ZXY-2]|nr:hypothetical protein ARZXY2_4144 [Arthrobacter sp. ZXY-2]